MVTLRDQLLKLGLVDEAKSSAPPPDAPKAVPVRVNQVVKNGTLTKTEGRKRFYFEARDARVTYLDLDDQTVNKLQRGEAAIAESPGGHVAVIDRAAADQVAEVAPEWLRFRAS